MFDEERKTARSSPSVTSSSSSLGERGNLQLLSSLFPH